MSAPGLAGGGRNGRESFAAACPHCGHWAALDPDGCCERCGEPRSIEAVTAHLAALRARVESNGVRFTGALEVALEAVEAAGTRSPRASGLAQARSASSTQGGASAGVDREAAE